MCLQLAYLAVLLASLFMLLSITEMNYDSGWSTLVLHRNSARIPNFPYHLCPTTLKIVESVPIAGRICGFNRQVRTYELLSDEL